MVFEAVQKLADTAGFARCKIIDVPVVANREIPLIFITKK